MPAYLVVMLLSPMLVGALFLMFFLYRRKTSVSSRGEVIARFSISVADTPLGRKFMWVMGGANLVFVVVSVYLLGWVGLASVVAPVVFFSIMLHGKQVFVYENGITNPYGVTVEFVPWSNIDGYRFRGNRVVLFLKDGRSLVYWDLRGELKGIVSRYLKEA